MNQHNLEITKTARYFTLGNEVDPEEVWFVLHGYAQLGNFFLKKFESLDNGKRLIVAPEGLHRFYWNGFSGRVVASWMTKEDRLVDIADYVNFLDSVYSKVVPKTATVRLLGFSQGTATACRWAVLGNSRFDRLTMWAGAFPTDVDYFENAGKLNALRPQVVIGDKDPYYDEGKIDEHLDFLRERGLEFSVHRFQGDHNIYPEPLREIV